MRNIRNVSTGTAAMIALVLGFTSAQHAAAAPTPEPPSPQPSATATTAPVPTPEPPPTPEPSPEPEPAPSPAPVPDPAPEPTPGIPGEDAEEGEEHHHHDGPTEPLIRELPESSPSLSTSALSRSSLPASYGPQPVFHFPWKAGYRWGASGSHSDSDGINRGAIDFAPLGSEATAVRAIAAGTVYRVRCSSGWFLGIDHGGGWMSEYYHLKGAKSSLIGTWVEPGAILGQAGQTLPCGGTPGTSAHVHLSILNSVVDVPSGKRKYIPVSGVQFEKYVLEDTSGAYNGVWRTLDGKTALTSRRVTCCLTSSTRVGPSSPRAVLPDTNGNGIDDRAEVRPWDTDVNSDGRADIVGFGTASVQVARSSGTRFGTMFSGIPGFGQKRDWSTSENIRTVMDVDGDGIPDIVGFRGDGIVVATGKGNGTFNTARRWLKDLGRDAGWTLGRTVRTLADVNGDGLPDVVGFGSAGVVVSLNTGTSFRPWTRWLRDMGSRDAYGGWNTTRHLRLVEDVTGDGRADLVGFGNRGVVVAVSTGSSFRAPVRWTNAFGRDRGWRTDQTPRMLTDVNGDGRPDIVGFGIKAVYVALNEGGGSFATAKKWTASFRGSAWKATRDSRTLADVTGDGRPDIVGFNRNGTYVARNTGSSFAAAARWTTDFGSREWTLGAMPRSVADVNGDGRADVVGFARDGVHVALSSGSRFGAATHWTHEFGGSATSGNWQVRTKPRTSS